MEFFPVPYFYSLNSKNSQNYHSDTMTEKCLALKYTPLRTQSTVLAI